ncbi:MAG: hypothetical protein ACRYFS_12070 [Janthinobacterium lividum]
MIRSNLPLPFLYRLRLRAGAAAQRAASSPVTHRQSRAGVRRPVTSDASQVWLHFIDQYELFTEVLCAAAKNGCDSRKETEYAQMRCWFVGNYYRTSSRVRPYLEAEFSAESAGPSVVDYAGQKRSLDALEALFLPPTLREVLKHDTGDLIPRVARISEVIYRCHAEWEQSQAR